jgi:hypothetical protein
VGGDSNSLAGRLLSLQNDVSAFLVDDLISAVATEHVDEFVTAEVSPKLHP